jgi:hypothetical protein
MDHLANRPAFVAVGSVELMRSETVNDRSEIGRRRGNLFDPLFAPVLVGLPVVPKLPYRVPEVLHYCPQAIPPPGRRPGRLPIPAVPRQASPP